jgi:hypothetical protein
MKAGVGLVVRSKRTIGPVEGVVVDEGPDDEDPQAAEIASSSESRGRRMAIL